MAKVTGIGGVFFKSPDPKGLAAWYREHLGLDIESWGGVTFPWSDPGGFTVWSPFAEDTAYFDPSDRPFMVNFRVDDLDGILEHLRDAGVEVDDRIGEYDYGRFGWFLDPEGTRIELWEPPPAAAGGGREAS